MEHSPNTRARQQTVRLLEGGIRFFLAGAASVEVDKQGRILIPSVLKEFAGINKEVALIGVASRIEIWSKERWEGESAYEDMESIAEHMSELGLGI